jgi:hypothetical protein
MAYAMQQSSNQDNEADLGGDKESHSSLLWKWQLPDANSPYFQTWAVNSNMAVRLSKKNVIDIVKRFNKNTDLHHSVKGRPAVSSDDDILLGVTSSLYKTLGASICSAAAEMISPWEQYIKLPVVFCISVLIVLLWCRNSRNTTKWFVLNRAIVCFPSLRMTKLSFIRMRPLSEQMVL